MKKIKSKWPEGVEKRVRFAWNEHRLFMENGNFTPEGFKMVNTLWNDKWWTFT